MAITIQLSDHVLFYYSSHSLIFLLPWILGNMTRFSSSCFRESRVKGFGAFVSRLTASNLDGTVARRDSDWEELFDFEIKFE